MVLLEHKAALNTDRFNWAAILKDVNKFGTLKTRIEKHGEMYAASLDHLNETEKADAYNCFVGDAFEIFCEYYMKTFNFDKDTGFSNYKPAQSLTEEQDDFGVDGYAIGANGNMATIQIKFRSDTTTLLTDEASLRGFAWESINRGVKLEDNSNMLVLTTAKGIHHATRDRLLWGKVMCIGYENFKQQLDGFVSFWDNFRKSLI